MKSLNWPSVVLGVAVIAGIGLALFFHSPEAVLALIGVLGTVLGIAIPATKARAMADIAAAAEDPEPVTLKPSITVTRNDERGFATGASITAIVAVNTLLAGGLVLVACGKAGTNPDGTTRTAADHAVYAAEIADCDAQDAARGAQGIQGMARCVPFAACRNAAAAKAGRKQALECVALDGGDR